MDADDLVARAQEGDPSAGAFLVSVYGSRLAGYARTIARDLSDADREQVSELAIERAVRKIRLFDSSRGSFFAWLRGFARYAVADWRRSSEHLEALSEVQDDGPPEPTELDESVREALTRSIGRLSETDQLIIGLKDIEGLSYELISERLGVAEEACRQRHSRAIRRLRDIVIEEEDVMKHVRGGE